MGFFGVKGPKELLASSISAALDEYFVVEPKEIESNLLNDAKVVLKNVRLQPQTNIMEYTENEVIVSNISGIVDEVTFSWAWSISSSSDSWVKDSTLTIKGLRFKAQLSYESKKNSENDAVSYNDKPKKTNESKLAKIQKEGSLEVYVRNQVENIIDALTLHVIDFDFTLELPSFNPEGQDQQITLKEFPTRIVAGGKQIEIRSLGRKIKNVETQNPSKEDNVLKQELLIKSLFINILSSSETKPVTLPLLEPFSYQAWATRYKGKRFSSFSTEVEFFGKPIDFNKHEESHCLSDESKIGTEEHYSSSITLHAGCQQIQILSQLGNLFLNKTDARTKDKIETAKASTQLTQEEKQEDDEYEVLKKKIISSSTFRFSFPGISLVLENDIKITLQSLTCQYHADGTVMKIMGMEGSGILVDNFPLVATKSDEGDSSYWIIDLISSTFSIENVVHKNNNNTPSEVIARIRLRHDLLKNIYQGVMDAVNSSTDRMTKFYSGQRASDNNVSKELKAESNWSIEVQGIIEIQFVNETIEMLQDSTVSSASSDVSLKSVSVNIDSPSFMFESQLLSCNGIIVESDPLGSLSVIIPAIAQFPEDKRVSVNTQISITLHSLNDVSEIHNFFNEFIIREKHSMKYAKVNESRTKTKPDILPISIPSINVYIQESDIHMNLNKLNLEGNEVQIQSINFQYGKSYTIYLTGVTTTNDECLEICVEVVNEINIHDTFVLLEPLYNSKISYDKGTIALKLNEFDGELSTPDQQDVPASTNQPSNISVPFPMVVSINKISIKTQDVKGEKECVKVSNFLFDVNPSFNIENDSNYLYDFIKFQFDELQSDLVKLPRTEFSTFINFDAKELRELSLAIPNLIQITVGHSSLFEWIGNAFNREEENNKEDFYKLPHVKIGKLQLDVSYDVTILSGKGSKLDVRAYTGVSDTTSDDLKRYYYQRIIKQVPGLIRVTSLLGANIVDTSVALGTIAMAANPYGGVIGVLGVDAIMNTLNAGRRSRGVDRDENYKAGDFTRGLMHSMEESTKAGMKSRGTGEYNESYKGNPLDFFVGASSGTVKYVDKNKAKLGGAGGAGAGLVLGTVVAGPIGAIAGGFIGAALTSIAIKETEEFITKKEVNAEEELLRHPEKHGEMGLSLPRGPQGLLYKLGGLLQNLWEPFWYILDIDKKILVCHNISENSPPKIDTNIFNPSNNLHLQKDAKIKDGDIQVDSDPTEVIQLSECEVEKNEKLSSDKLQLFAFTITLNKSMFFKERYHLVSETKEIRSMWVAMIADMTGNMKSLDKLLETS